MIRGTTPRIEFNLPFDASVFSVFYITFVQNGRTIFEKSNKDCEVSSKKITVQLTQEDTLKLCNDFVEMQIRGKTSDGNVLASSIMVDHADRILKEGVI